MTRAIALVAVFGCGRVGFPARQLDAAIADVAAADVASDSAMLCTSSAPAVCGDACCEGNSGELCATCPSDCATTAPVCGNGTCDAGEDSVTCYADCGPSPWTWTSDEAMLLASLNSARTGGTKCPGKPNATAPALSSDPTLLAGARQNVWEIAHQNYFQPNGDVCNGQTFADLQATYGFTAQVTFYGNPTTAVSSAATSWLGDANLCPIVMNPGLTLVAATVARDVNAAFLVRMK